MDKVLRKFFVCAIVIFGLSGNYSFAVTVPAGHHARHVANKPTKNHKIFLKKNFNAATDPVITSTSGSFVICQGNNITLTVNPAPPGATFAWYNSSGAIPGATAQTYTTNVPGFYGVSVINSGVYVNAQVVLLTAGPTLAPVIDTARANSNPCTNNVYTFTGSNTGYTGSLNYLWNFNDPASGAANTSAQQSPTHTFTIPNLGGVATYTVSLKVTDPVTGCSDSTKQTITFNQPSALLVPNLASNTDEITINGTTVFRFCNNTPGKNPSDTLSIQNGSSTFSTIKQYNIDWGDGSAAFNSATFPKDQVLTHIYTSSTTLTYTVTDVNGCTVTAKYTVFIGGNPSIGLEKPANTSICSGDSINFIVNGTDGNPPGTTYEVLVNDGTAPVFYSTPPKSFTHVFTKASCSASTSGNSNAFSVEIIAFNPCSNSSATVEPIYVSQRPQASFITSTNFVCAGTPVTLTNTSPASISSSNAGCVPGGAVWSISPATGWTVNSGSLGNKNGVTNPQRWDSGSDVVNVTFTVPGNYTLGYTTGNNTCGTDSVPHVICVNPPPIASFKVDNTNNCGSLNVKTTNTSSTPNCGNNYYRWKVTYSNTSCTTDTGARNFINSTNDTSANPQFQFHDPGLYKLTLTTTGPDKSCSATSDTVTITVKAKPIVTLPAIGTICQYNKILPSATVLGCYSTAQPTYLWTFTGGTPSTSTAANPDSVQYSTPGTYTVSLAVTNDCGTTTTVQQVVVTTAPTVTAPPNMTFCGGATVGPLNFTSSANGTTFNWINDNTSIGLQTPGTGNIPSFTAVNNGTAPQIAHITVTPVNGCFGLPVTFTITVNPSPAAPAANTTVTYCLNDAASPLTAAADNGNTLRWYMNSPPPGGGGGAAGALNAPVPSTLAAGTTNYYVTQVNSGGCEGPATEITVTVNPPINGNSVGTSQSICAGSAAVALTTTGTITGGNGIYSYQWQYSTDNGKTWAQVAGNGNNPAYNPGILSDTGTFLYQRIITSGSCQSLSNIITITVKTAIANYDISGSQTICSGTAPPLLTGQTPVDGSGAIAYQWQASPDNINYSDVSGATGVNYQPGTLTATTYYQRKVSNGTCTVISSTVTITVNPSPVVSTLPNQTFCNGSTVPAINFTSIPSNNTTFAWTSDNTAIGLPVSSGTSGIASFTAVNNTKVPVTGTITVTATYTSGGVSCVGVPFTFTITVLPTITIKQNQGITVCGNGPVPAYNPVSDAQPFPNISLSYMWTVSGDPIGISNGAGSQVPAFTAVNNGATDITGTITVTPVYGYNGLTCNGTPMSYTDTINAAPTVASAGSNVKVCTDTYQLNGNAPVTGTGMWTQVSGPDATITNPAAPNTTVTGLKQGNIYKFTWTISNNTCAASSSTITIEALSHVLASFTKTPVQGCGAQTITFTNTSAPLDSATYHWIFGNGQSSASTQLSGPVVFAPAKLNHDTTYYITLAASNGCDSTVYTDSVTVIPPLKSVFSPVPTIGCSPLTVNITNQSTGIADNFTFDFGDKSAPLVTNSYTPFQHTYVTTKVDTFTIKLTATNACGVDSSFYKIVVYPNSIKPNLVVNGDSLSGCAPMSVTFHNNTTGANHFVYDFGDKSGELTTLVAPEKVTHIFTNPGTYIVKLTASNGCSTADTTQTITVVGPPVVNFTTDKPQYCLKQPVVITNSSSVSPAITYSWNFGDSTISNQVNPVHIYKSAGTYTITLTAIKDSAGTNCSTTTSKQVTVFPLPAVTFTSNYGNPHCAPFLLKVSSQPTNASYVTWSFGDAPGTSDTTSGFTAQHLYTNAGTYTVTMIAYNAANCSDTTVQTFQFNPSPVANFTVAPNTSCVPFAASITNNSTNADSYQWYVNNVPVSTDQTPANIEFTQFNQTYSIKLVVANQYGCAADSMIKTVTTSPKPFAAFTLKDSLSCTGSLNLNVTNTSQNATSYTWIFGDKSPNDTSKTPTHTYAANGIYQLKLIAQYGTCSDSVTHTIQVNNPPKSVFTTNVTSGCSPLTVNITNQSTGNFNQYTYNFGDGSTPLMTNRDTAVNHTYITSKVDTFRLKLTAQNACGKDSLSYAIVVYPDTVKANLVINGDSLTGCAPFTVVFNNNSTGANNFIYNFGDGSDTTTLIAPEKVSHTFKQAGTYLVKLKASNPCVADSTIKTIKVIAPPVVSFATDKPLYCLHQATVFTNNSPSSPFITYQWNFGDNTTSDQVSPTHTYQLPGTYTITLTAVKDTAGISCSATVSHQVIVSPLPAVTFTNNIDSINCAPFLLKVSSQPTDATRVVWTFSSSTMPTYTTQAFNAQYLYTVPGTVPSLDTVTMIAFNASGCSDTTQKIFRVYPSPVASFNVPVSISSVPFTVSVNNTSTNDGTDHSGDQWTLTNITPGTQPVTTGLPGSPNTSLNSFQFDLTTPNQIYVLTLVATNQYGCKSAIATDTLYTAPKPVPLFTLQDSVSCTGQLVINVTNNTLYATSYTWSFGDGTPNQTTAIPTHTYGPGTYVLQLTATNGLWSETVSNLIEVTTTPTARFTQDITSGCDTITTTFTNLSVNAIAYKWVFGDGDTIYTTSKDPQVHNYTYTNAPYTVALIALGKFGCNDTITMKNLIDVSFVTANFVPLPSNIIKIPDYTFTFNNLTTVNLPGDSITYSWDFGDSTLPTAEKNPKHTYKDTGKFVVTLKATDMYGCTSIKIDTVEVKTVPQYLYVPNAFEPANINSKIKIFNVMGAGMVQYSLQIFNIWGQLLFQTSALDINGSPTEGWDGTMAGKPAPQGGYIWKISAKFIDGTLWTGMKYNSGSTPSTTGIIHLIR